MTEHRIVRQPDPETAALWAALLLTESIAEALASRNRAFVMLSGGATPRLMYHAITHTPDTDAAVFRCTDYYIGDERPVPWSSSDSNVGEAIRGLLDPLAVPLSRRHFPDCSGADLDEEARLATSEMLQTVPLDGARRPVFDVVMLGIGGDGHTASLFPGTAALEDRTPRYVANVVPQLGQTRLTVTYPVLNAARHVVVLCTGASKAAVVAVAASPTPGTDMYPVTAVRPCRLTWILDEAAASLLT